MPRGQFLDAPGGDPVTHDVVTEDRYRLPPILPLEEDAQRNFDSIPKKKCRDDDILLVSYPKTGTHWLWEMINMLVLGQPEVTSDAKGPGMLENRPEEVQDALPSPRILNTHIKFKYLPKQAREKKLKCVLLCRNPKDTVVSFYNHTKGISKYHYDGKFDNYFAMFLRGEVDYGSYPEYLLEWQEAIRDNPDWPIHVVYYEDLQENCLQEMTKLCNYLGRDINEGLLRQIVENCDIDKMRKTKTENATEEMKERIKHIFKNQFNPLRKGQVGGWRNWFTVAQNETFDKWWTESTKGLDMFKFRYI